jgi:hypothetical protein
MVSMSPRTLDPSRKFTAFQQATAELSKLTAIAKDSYLRPRAVSNCGFRVGFTRQTSRDGPSNQVLALNGQCHDCDRKAKVNRMTSRSPEFGRKDGFLTLATRD